MQFRDKSPRKAVINITSLIDVLFLLLIFFIVTSRFIEQPAMKLILPETSMQEISIIKGYTLFITSDGTLFLNEEKINFSVLLERLKKIAPQIEEKGLIVKADETVNYGIVIKAMDIAKKSGINKLIVATKLKTDR